MNIARTYSIENIFGEPPYRDVKNVSEIVIHHTAGDGGWSALEKWMTSPTCERKEQYKKFVGLTHFYIEKNGRIVQIFDIGNWAYHSCSGKHDSKTIGIELCHTSGKFTDHQYTSLIELIQHIYQTCPIKTIVSHDYNYKVFSGKTKGCPGKEFDWNFLKAELQALNIDVEMRYYE